MELSSHRVNLLIGLGVFKELREHKAKEGLAPSLGMPRAFPDWLLPDRLCHHLI